MEPLEQDGGLKPISGYGPWIKHDPNEYPSCGKGDPSQSVGKDDMVLVTLGSFHNASLFPKKADSWSWADEGPHATISYYCLPADHPIYQNDPNFTPEQEAEFQAEKQRRKEEADARYQRDVDVMIEWAMF